LVNLSQQKQEADKKLKKQKKVKKKGKNAGRKTSKSTKKQTPKQKGKGQKGKPALGGKKKKKGRKKDRQGQKVEDAKQLSKDRRENQIQNNVADAKMNRDMQIMAKRIKAIELKLKDSQPGTRSGGIGFGFGLDYPEGFINWTQGSTDSSVSPLAPSRLHFGSSPSSLSSSIGSQSLLGSNFSISTPTQSAFEFSSTPTTLAPSRLMFGGSSFSSPSSSSASIPPLIFSPQTPLPPPPPPMLTRTLGQIH